MSTVIIDGYNVIGTDHRDAEKVREVFISRLIAYRKATGHTTSPSFLTLTTGNRSVRPQRYAGG
ncbi:MAG: hypothetical protein MZV70_28295 [Desulfobacterales bacterium]|nr:hypothetical protein [Desulfobacterales bacterium]